MIGRRVGLAAMLLPMMLLRAQAKPTVDSLGVSTAIARQLIAHSATDSARAFVVDTEGSSWAVLVYRRLREQAPKLVPSMSDSLAHYATHLAMSVVAAGHDTLSASIVWRGCYSQTGYAFSRRSWLVVPDGATWVVHPADAVTTGHGVCTPFSPRKGGS